MLTFVVIYKTKKLMHNKLNIYKLYQTIAQVTMVHQPQKQ